MTDTVPGEVHFVHGKDEFWIIVPNPFQNRKLPIPDFRSQYAVAKNQEMKAMIFRYGEIS